MRRKTTGRNGKRQTELNEKGKGKTREEVQKLEEEMNAEWAPVRDQILKERQDLINQRYSDVIAAVKKVAESQNLLWLFGVNCVYPFPKMSYWKCLLFLWRNRYH